MRARAAAACAAAGVIIGGAGCTAGSAQPQASHPQASQVGVGVTTPAPLARPDRAQPTPGCSTATARSPSLSGVTTAMVSVPASPFGVAVTPDGRWAFVAVGIPAGQFPREMALEPNGQHLLVTNFASGQLEAVSIPQHPVSAGSGVSTPDMVGAF